ncbi:MAG: hypothetical protein HC841_03835 [Verrucomicrobiae bacterium]|nr:hypothetical protein [Verrucomicrobiae bacterium]
MKTKAESQQPLVCPDCGHSNHFLEVMAEEVHVVNRYRNYIRLLQAHTDHYLCPECGKAIYENQGN